MSAPKRVWSGQGVSVDKVIARKLADLDEQIVRQVDLAIEASRQGQVDVKELTKAHDALSDVLKRKQGDKVARQQAARESRRRRALEGESNPALSSGD